MAVRQPQSFSGITPGRAVSQPHSGACVSLGTTVLEKSQTQYPQEGSQFDGFGRKTEKS
jgi:hypothetical protein